MEYVYDRASAGTLTADDLQGRSEEINYVNPKTGLTPLGVAVWNGHVRDIQLLLRNGADPDGSPRGRPPLWVAASRTKGDAGRIIEILLDHKANVSLPSAIDENTTPLLGAVKNRRSPEVVSLLVDAGASPTAANSKRETPHSVAERSNNRALMHAMLSRSQRSSNLLEALLMTTGLILSIVAWANQNIRFAATIAAGAATLAAAGRAAAGAIKKRFGMSGLWAPGIPAKLEGPRLKSLFKKDMRDYIKATNLDRFFPPGDTFLEKVVEKAVELHENPENSLDVKDLTRLSLYQPVLYCDDSLSMKLEGDGRAELQNQLVQRIASITTRLVPDDGGIQLRFINQETNLTMSKPDSGTINNIMASLSLDGWTEIGTNLKRKVLDELVYTPLANGTFKQPVLVSITTDGCPEGGSEREDTLQEAILECGDILEKHGYDRQVVRFQISQIGNDDRAAEFLRHLRSDSQLRDVLYCTTRRLDEEFRAFRDNERRLEQWLMKLLMSPILEADPA